MTEGTNEDFGLPLAKSATVETEDQRLARLRSQAAAAVAKETDEATLKRLIAEERAKFAPPSPDGQGFDPRYSRVVIYQGDDKKDNDFVFLSVNGYSIKAPRGEEIIIPHVFVTDVLERAIEEKTVRSQGGYITRPAHRFHWSVKGSATPEEYQVYLATQRSKAQREIAQSTVQAIAA